MANTNPTKNQKYLSLAGMEHYTDEVKKLIRKMIDESSDFEIETADSYLHFPVVGNVNHIYIDTTDNATYRWNQDDLHYYCIGRDWENIDLINANM